jgi:hypothetical protein
MVTTMIIRTELKPVILATLNPVTKRRLRVTTTIESAKERRSLSKTLICLKKIRVQAKPGRKNTNMKPSIALMAGTRSRKGKTNPNSSLIGDSQSTLFISLHQYSVRIAYDFTQYS